MQILVVDSPQKGFQKAKEILYSEIDHKTVLFLSGGTTPKPLYEILSKEHLLKPAAVGMIDERFGEPFHLNSNELMIQRTGFLDYLAGQQIPFYSMLGKKKTCEELAEKYDQQVRDLFFKFPKSIAVVGIGVDGHIAGIVPERKDFHNPLFDPSQQYLYVAGFSDTKKYKERITMTFAGLSLIDRLIVVVFGKEKQKALKKAFTPGSMEEVPARFFQQPDIAKKTLFITDQKI